MGDDETVTAIRIESERVVLREGRDGDADGVVEIQTDEGVRRYLGGPRPEQAVRDGIATGGLGRLTAGKGSYVVADRTNDAMLGTVLLSRRDREAPATSRITETSSSCPAYSDARPGVGGTPPRRRPRSWAQQRASFPTNPF